MPVNEPARPDPLPDPLALFPLQTVLFPGSVLWLKVFEPRYLDLMTRTLRDRQPFGVICLKQGSEAGRSAKAVQMEQVGVLAHVEEVDADQPGLLRVRCSGTQRFRRRADPVQLENGLWVCSAERLADDPPRMPGPAMLATVEALAGAIRTLSEQGRMPFAQPYRLDDAGWVANRWCELLPLPLKLKQQLMELENPLIRLELVSDVLSRTGIASD